MFLEVIGRLSPLFLVIVKRMNPTPDIIACWIRMVKQAPNLTFSLLFLLNFVLETDF